jgi:two-component system, LytTR family, sensor kinase
MDHQVKYRQAREHISAIKGFYIHGLVFLLVIAGLLVLNFALGKPYWVLWVLLGWGAGVALHAALVFGGSSSFVSRWERRKMKELMEQDDRRGVGGDRTGKPAS